MNRAEIVEIVSALSDRHGDLLKEMLDLYNKKNLLELTDEECDLFFDLIKRRVHNK